MFCPKCGTKLDDGALFCSNCGAQLGAKTRSAYDAHPATPPLKKKRRTAPLIIAAAIVVVIAAVAGIGFATGLFGGGGPVYVMTERVLYRDGDPLQTTTYERNDAGDIETQTTKIVLGDYENEVVYSYSHDEFGYITRLKQTSSTSNGQSGTVKIQYDNELDEQHRLVRSENKDSDGSVSTEKTEYHDNGVIKSRHSETKSGNTKTESTRVYDERGLMTSYAYARTVDDEEADGYEYSLEWKLDSRGRPESVEITSYRSGDKTTSVVYKLECDDAGNVVKVFDEDGNLYMEFSYKKIDNPSIAARLNASTFSML